MIIVVNRLICSWLCISGVNLTVACRRFQIRGCTHRLYDTGNVFTRSSQKQIPNFFSGLAPQNPKPRDWCLTVYLVCSVKGWFNEVRAGLYLQTLRRDNAPTTCLSGWSTSEPMENELFIYSKYFVGSTSKFYSLFLILSCHMHLPCVGICRLKIKLFKDFPCYPHLGLKGVDRGNPVHPWTGPFPADLRDSPRASLTRTWVIPFYTGTEPKPKIKNFYVIDGGRSWTDRDSIVSWTRGCARAKQYIPRD
jgi:hypothetical protein